MTLPAPAVMEEQPASQIEGIIRLIVDSGRGGVDLGVSWALAHA
jgi:hypothetical protein